MKIGDEEGLSSMTPNRNQKALDALEFLEEHCWIDDPAEEVARSKFKTIRQALTAQPVTDDEVSEVHEYLAGKYFIIKHGLYYRPEARGYTANPNEAGVFSHVEAHDHLDGCSELSTKPAYRIRAAQRDPDAELVKALEDLLNNCDKTEPNGYGNRRDLTPLKLAKEAAHKTLSMYKAKKTA